MQEGDEIMISLNKKSGYTLVELLAVLAVLMIVLTISLSVFRNLDRLANQRIDEGRIVIYNKAFEDFKFNDYSTLQATKDEKVILTDNDGVKINQYLNLSSEDINALSESGKGRYPKTLEECTAAIRAYCGTSSMIPTPALGMSYRYYYHIPSGKCFVKHISEIDASNQDDWINLNDDYAYLVAYYMLGDVSGDKTLDEKDVETLLSFINGGYSFNDPYLYRCCDTNRDGKVNNRDLMLLQTAIQNGTTLNWGDG